MKRYETYKDSGIKWIGEIPKHWVVNKFGRSAFFQEGPGLRRWQFTDEGIKVICVTNIVPPVIDFSKMIKYISKEEYEESYKHFKVNKGDIMLASSGASWGKVAEYVNDETVILNTSTIRLNENDEKVLEKEFIKWVIMSSYISENLNILLTGSCQPNFGPTHLNKLVCVYPKSKSEQIQIANYLEQKTTQIEELIANKEQLIQLLEEERKAIINQAVTKGLNPDAQMKDSGINWLGEIPEHWKNHRIDWIAKLIRGNTGLKKDELLDKGEYVALQYGKTYKVNEVNNTFKYYVNSEYYKQSQIVNFGDTIIISTSETIEDLGHSCYYNRNDLGLIGGEQILLKPDSRFIFNKYLYYYSKKIGSVLQKYAKGLKVLRFKIDDLKQISIPLPPIQEQIKIVKYLDSEMGRIRSLKKLYKKEIELLKEYKTTLISEAVTGKIDVREEVLN